MQELNEISAHEPDNVIKVNDFDELVTNLNTVLRLSCSPPQPSGKKTPCTVVRGTKPETDR